MLILGGFHGDEPKSVRLVESWAINLKSPAAPQTYHIRWIVVPVVNPDGYATRRRRNARGVDINRNFPTDNWSDSRRAHSPRSRMYGGPRPASEPETRAVIRLVERVRPVCIVTVHSISGGRCCNNYDGPARRLAKTIAKCNGYPVAATIGYPTPGSFGTWAGIERCIPTITLELPAEHSFKQCLTVNENVVDALARYIRRGHRSS